MATQGKIKNKICSHLSKIFTFTKYSDFQNSLNSYMVQPQGAHERQRETQTLPLVLVPV